MLLATRCIFVPERGSAQAISFARSHKPFGQAGIRSKMCVDVGGKYVADDITLAKRRALATRADQICASVLPRVRGAQARVAELMAAKAQSRWAKDRFPYGFNLGITQGLNSVRHHRLTVDKPEHRMGLSVQGSDRMAQIHKSAALRIHWRAVAGKSAYRF